MKPLPRKVQLAVMCVLAATEPSGRKGVYNIADLKLRCVVDELTGCWHWRGAADPKDGVGKVWLPILDAVVTVPRAAALLTDRPVPRGQHALAYRLCHSETCANPLHIAVGTRADGGKTRAEADRLKGDPKRIALNTASRRRSAKLNPQVVREIRASDEPGTVLAARHGIDASNVSAIRLGKTWREVAPAASVFTWRPQRQTEPA